MLRSSPSPVEIEISIAGHDSATAPSGSLLIHYIINDGSKYGTLLFMARVCSAAKKKDIFGGHLFDIMALVVDTAHIDV